MVELTAEKPFLTDRFVRAFAMASEIHATQVRKGTKVPYIAHLMSVAALVLEHGGGDDAAIGGLLHDAVEDSTDGKATEARIRRDFGDRVGDIVMGCSDAVAVPGQAKGPWAERKCAYIKRLRSEKNCDILLVSACDKLHNCRTIVADLRDPTIGAGVWNRFSEKDPAKQICYYKELVRAYGDKIASRLRDELERTVDDLERLRGGQASG